MDVAECVVRNQVVRGGQDAGAWESIIVPRAVKERLLYSVLLGLTVRPKLSFHVTALHGLTLLVGPPGTGKSTLARGLPSQVAANFGTHAARFIEVNPHGLMSAEHGQSQQRVSKLLGEYIPTLADDGLPTIVLLDEVETMAVARGAASLAANPADVHRATDAVLTALDDVAARAPHIFTVATSNFTDALDAALMSRADLTIRVPLPDAGAIQAILASTLRGFAQVYPNLARLAGAGELDGLAQELVGRDGRAVRKLVTEAMVGRLETTLDPGLLTIADLQRATDGIVIDELEADRASN